MDFLLFEYQCAQCSGITKVPGLPETSYGEFIMFNDSGESAYLNVFKDDVFSEFEALFKEVSKEFNSINKKNEDDIFKKIFSITCDVSSDSTRYRIIGFPTCKSCGAREMASWKPASPPAFTNNVKVVTHKEWITLDENEKKKKIRDAIKDQINSLPIYHYLKECKDERSAHLKKILVELFLKYEHYLDKKFCSEIQKSSQFISRIWELTLIDYLKCLELKKLNEFKVLNDGKDSRSEPDFSFKIHDKKFYLEAVAARRGSAEELNTPVPINEVYHPLVDSYKERLSTVISAKIKKYKEGYHEVIKNDGFIIAISMADINIMHQSGLDEDDLSCLFAMNSENGRIHFTSDKNIVKKIEYNKQNGYLKKNSSATILNNYFACNEFSFISAVLISHGCSTYPSKFNENYEGLTSSGFILIHNPYAKKPLPTGVLPVIREYTTEINGDIKVINNEV